jgi:hypothetical protein
MTREVNVLWVRPNEYSLRLVPGAGSISNQIPLEHRKISYDGQSNCPITSTVDETRKLQSACLQLRNPINLGISFLDLTPVPRRFFIDDSWERQGYLSEPIKIIPLGDSQVEVRRIGLDIQDVPGLSGILSSQDVAVVPFRYEMNFREGVRVGRIIKGMNPKIKLLASGLGGQSREEELLEAGFDAYFMGSVTDRGEEVLEALIEGDIQKLKSLPGVYSNIRGEQIRNLGPRNFRQPPETRHENIFEWRARLSRYFDFVDINPNFIGRPDLVTGSGIDPFLENNCSFQDLPFEIVSKIVASGNKYAFYAGDISPSVGCFRSDCSFCSSTGMGYATKSADYVLKQIDFWASRGATDIIPTDDALFPETTNPAAMENMNRIFRDIKRRGILLFTGNGLSTQSLERMIEGANKGEKETREFLNLVMETTGSFYLPQELLAAVEGDKDPGLSKLRNARESFENVLRYISQHSSRNPHVVVDTNIILPPEAPRGYMHRYYGIMDEISGRFPRLMMRYNCFFIIPTVSAPHCSELETEYGLSFANEHRELKNVAVPTVAPRGEDSHYLERQLVDNILERNSSNTARRLKGGTYRE